MGYLASTHRSIHSIIGLKGAPLETSAMTVIKAASIRRLTSPTSSTAYTSRRSTGSMNCHCGIGRRWRPGTTVKPHKLKYQRSAYDTVAFAPVSYSLPCGSVAFSHDPHKFRTRLNGLPYFWHCCRLAMKSNKHRCLPSEYTQHQTCQKNAELRGALCSSGME